MMIREVRVVKVDVEEQRLGGPAGLQERLDAAVHHLVRNGKTAWRREARVAAIAIVTAAAQLFARQGYPVVVDGREIGAVTSGMPSPTLGKNLAYALVEASGPKIGAEVEVLVRGKPVAAVVARTPFYKARYKK